MDSIRNKKSVNEKIHGKETAVIRIRRILLTFGMLLLMLGLVTGCGKSKQESQSGGLTVTSGTLPEIQETTTEAATEKQEAATEAPKSNLKFRSKKLLQQHYDKHGAEMGFPDLDSYVAAANDVISDPETLHKIEKEDGDDVYYRERDNAFVVVSTDGYIRTFFYPSGGKSYFDRQ